MSLDVVVVDSDMVVFGRAEVAVAFGDLGVDAWDVILDEISLYTIVISPNGHASHASAERQSDTSNAASTRERENSRKPCVRA